MCNTLRTDEKGMGYCKIPDKIYLSHYGLHYYEEPVISGKNGSGTIFFSGCNLKCEYCQNYIISRDVCGKPFTVDEFIQVIKDLEKQNAENINLVSPTPYSHLIIEALKKYKPSIPIVYNTSGYERPEIIKELLPYVDIFLTDFKYGDDALAEKYSHCKNYVEFCKKSLIVMSEKENKFNNNDIMISGVICRHLILPNHIENTKKVLDILKELNIQIVSIMAQFTPIDNPSCDLNRVITKREYEKVLYMLDDYDFDGFVQDRDSSGKEYVPKFCFIQQEK